MATVRPFHALRPTPARVHLVASPPYDVIDTREARALAAGNPDSFLRVSRPEIDMPEGVDEHDASVYTQGAMNLADLCARGVLARDPSAHLYVYAQTMNGRRQVGVAGCVSVDEYDRDVIRKHEKTRAAKEDDRARHVEALNAHDEPVFLAYRADADINAAVAAVTAEAPDYDFVTADGVRHTLWVVPEGASLALSARFEKIPALYVADGHHRSAAASRVHADRAGEPGDHDVFLAVLFPDEQLRIMAYNRVVRDRMGRSPEALLAALGSAFELAPTDDPVPPAAKHFCVFAGGRWYRAAARPGTWNANDPVASLDVSIVQEQCLAGLFGIADPRRDPDVDFVGGIRGTAELERRVRDEGWSLALSMHPTAIGDLLAVSDAGLLMPPKSTWFEPKLRSGLFVHPF